MRQFRLDVLVQRAKEAIDAENQRSITDQTWRSWIGTANGTLHGIVASTGYRYFESVQTIVTDGLNSLFALSADHYMSGTVVRVVTEQDRRRLIRASAQETALMPRGAGAQVGSEASRWAQIGQSIYLGPYRPPAGQTYEHIYVPQPLDLTDAVDATLVDVVTSDGEAFIINAAAVKGLLKQDKDPRLHRDERDEARANLEAWASTRALLERHVLQGGDDFYGSRDPAEYTDRTGG